MALTITIEGKGVIANSDATTNDTGGTGTGDWAELGGGSISLSTETYLRGTNCVAGAYSNKAGWHYFDIGAGNELDFDTAGNEEGQFIYLPIFNPTPGLNETETNGGLRVRVGTDATNYREFMILAGDDFNGWNGSWKTFVIDPTKTGSVADTGTFDVGSVRRIGIYVDATALAKGDNIFIDQISVGFGLRITGTSTVGWQDVVDYCTDYPNRAWGMFEKRGDTYYCKGKIFIGDTGQTSATSFADSGRSIQFEKSEYWNGSAWVSTLPTDAFGIVLEDAAGFATTFSDGILVGSDNGRSGTTIVGNDNEDIIIDFSQLTNAGSLVTLYGTTFKSIYGSITFEGDSDHKYYGCTFVDCEQVVPSGSPVIENCAFAETASVDSALLWNENIDITNCQFIANTVGAAIEHPSSAGTPYTHSGLLYSGNTNDVLNSSGSAITINKTNGSNPSTSEGSSVTFSASFEFTVTGLELNTELTIVTADTETVLFHQENATVSDGDGKYKAVYTHSGGESVDVLIHHVDYEPDISNIYGLTLPNLASNAKVQMFDDPNYFNPT